LKLFTKVLRRRETMSGIAGIPERRKTGERASALSAYQKEREISTPEIQMQKE